MSLSRLRDRYEMLKDEMVEKDRIIEVLKDGPKSLAEITALINRPGHEVMCWLMAMRRYGQIKETGQNDKNGNATYNVVEEEPNS